MQDCWAISDTQDALQHALKDRGYTLARGDRRGYVALDHRCEVFSISKKWVGKSAKDVRARLTNPEALPSVEKARVQIAVEMATRLSALQKQQETAIIARLSEIEQKRVQMVQTQQAERWRLEQVQQARQHYETRARQERYSKCLRGLLDRLTGKRRKIKEENERDTLRAQERDRQEQDQLIFSQLDQRRTLQARIERLHAFSEKRGHTLARDVDQYREVQQKKRDTFNLKNPQPQRGPELSL